MTIDVMQWTADDPELAVSVINEAYGFERPMTISGDTTGFRCTLWHATAGEIGAGRVRHTMSANAVIAPPGYFLTTTLREGRFDDLEVADERTRAGRGDTIMASQESQVRATWRDIGVQTLGLPLAVIERVARERTGARDRVRFESVLPISPAAAQRWQRLTSFVHQELSRPESILEASLVQAQVAELIAGTALVSFANSAMADAGSAGHAFAAPASIRRAVAFIDANAERAITITEIADSAGVTPRALQYGFARHLDSSPTAYLRRVRLEHAHEELTGATPGDGMTVAAVARRWGFAKPSRFAAAYRAAYGRPPSGTLQR
jgi:AraC-like DNA-binding protein